jgi:hypothetical protein
MPEANKTGRFSFAIISAGIAIAISIASLTISYLTFRGSEENLDVFKTKKIATMSVDNGSEGPTLRFEYPITIVNRSTNAVSIQNLSCESGEPVRVRKAEGRFHFMNSCAVYEVEKGGRGLAVNHINIGAKQASELILVSFFPAPQTVMAEYKKYARAGVTFDDEEFLLLLAKKGMDFFGNNFGVPHAYLQKTYGENLCVGGEVYFQAKSEKGVLNRTIGYYVGRITPIRECAWREGRVIIEDSVPYKRDLFDRSQPL